MLSNIIHYKDTIQDTINTALEFKVVEEEVPEYYVWKLDKLMQWGHVEHSAKLEED